MKFDKKHFRLNSARIVIQDGKVLMVCDKKYYYAIGGAVYFNQKASDAAI